ncbi:hypothetical protein EG329_001468 [Mollisiaceae sp. DMI_Dod_QoI]|nr:hypothetical protein EG329_001468 [Helotiales sp. DMI_Dod_QoI]
MAFHGGFDFDLFIEKRFEGTRVERNTFNTKLPLIPAVSRQVRRCIEDIVEDIDSGSAKALLLRAVVEHPRHIGEQVVNLCETFSNTNGDLWSWSDPTHKTKGDIMAAIDTLNISLIHKLLVDAVLSYRDVATRLAAAERRQSRELHEALRDIQSYHYRCHSLIRELCLDWRDIGSTLRGKLLPNPISNLDSNDDAAEELASLLIKLQSVVQRVPRWETRRDTMLTFERIASTIATKLPQSEESFWGGLIAPLMIQTTSLMPKRERAQYVQEGFYYGLVKLCPFLPTESATSLYRRFLVSSLIIDRSRAAELAMTIRKHHLAQRRSTPASARGLRGLTDPSRISKKSNRQRRRLHGRAVIHVKVEE